jgi:hypothetical protein
MAISKRRRWRVLQRDNYTCRYCGAFAPLVILEVDHVTPRSRGGSDDMGNLVTACADCNAGKSDAMPDPSLAEEIGRAAAEWLRVSPPEPDESLYYEAEIYRDALRLLETVPGEELRRLIDRLYEIAPYQPPFREVVIWCGMTARDVLRKGAPNGPS